MAWQYTNFASSTLAGGVSASATSLTVASGEGALFPTSGDFPLVLIRNSDGAREIVTCTARSSDVLTVTREQEGTTGLILLTGDKVELRVTAGVLDSYVSTAADIDQVAASINHAVHTEAAHATTSDIWTGGNTCLLSGAVVTFTALAAAPQAGATRYVVANDAHIFTDGATFEVDGNANYTCVAGDVLLITAKTTSTFRVNVISQGDRTIPTNVTHSSWTATSAASHNFGSLPDWATEFILIFDAVSFTGTDVCWIRLGDSGGLHTTNYSANASRISNAPAIAMTTSTGEFQILSDTAAGDIRGVLTIRKIGALNTYIATGQYRLFTIAERQGFTNGTVTLDTVLTDINILSSGGGNFDNGAVTLMYR